jgi:ribonuclease P protein component
MPPEAAATSGQKPPDQRLGRRHRLISPLLFDEAYKQNRKFVGRFMVMFLRSGDGAALRLGVVTGRKLGGAPVRTRSRRLLREVFRRNRSAMKGAFDVVLLGRAGLALAPWAEVTKDFLTIAKRSGLLADD